MFRGRLTPSLPVMNNVYGSTDNGSSICWRISSAKSSGNGRSACAPPRSGTRRRHVATTCRARAGRLQALCHQHQRAWSPTSALMFSLTDAKWSMSTCISISAMPPEAASATIACSSGLPAPRRSGASSMLTGAGWDSTWFSIPVNRRQPCWPPGREVDIDQGAFAMRGFNPHVATDACALAHHDEAQPRGPSGSKPSPSSRICRCRPRWPTSRSCSRTWLARAWRSALVRLSCAMRKQACSMLLSGRCGNGSISASSSTGEERNRTRACQPSAASRPSASSCGGAAGWRCRAVWPRWCRPG